MNIVYPTAEAQTKMKELLWTFIQPPSPPRYRRKHLFPQTHVAVEGDSSVWICVFLTRLASQWSKDAALISSCSKEPRKAPGTTMSILYCR